MKGFFRALTVVFAFAASSVVVHASESERVPLRAGGVLVAHNYLVFSNFERFVAALEGSRKDAGPPIKEGSAAYTVYKNVHTMESFLAALEDNCKGRACGNIHDKGSFSASLEDGYAPETYPGITGKNRSNAFKAGNACAHIDMDFLAGQDLAARCK